MPEQTPASVAVVVLSKDEPELRSTLEALHDQCDAVGARCVVIDASDGRLDAIRDAHPWVQWCDYRQPLGVRTSIPHQRNAGVRVADVDIIVFCDAGGIPEPGWLAALIAPIQAGTFAVTTGPIRSTRGIYGLIHDLPDGEVVEEVFTGNVAFTRGAFDAIGGFDERYAYGSDVDFSWRLADAGFPARSVRGAVMGIDWGHAKRQRARAWRYGRARARLWCIHRARRVRILRESPDQVVYPVWILGAPVALALGVTWSWWWSLGWVAILGVFVVRHIPSRRPWVIVSDHLIFALGYLVELLLAPLGRAPVVLQLPQDGSHYIEHLSAALATAGVTSGSLVGPTRSASVNLVLAPWRLVLWRLRGARIVHLHWTYGFCLPWMRGPLRRLARWWFALWCTMVKLVGLRLVWTGHNILPHSPVFDDDTKARRTLVRRADGICAYSRYAKTQLETRFGAAQVRVVAAAAVQTQTTISRDEARVRLGLDDGTTCAIFVGAVAPYKGLDGLLEEIARRGLGPDVRLYIAGYCADPTYRAEITTLHLRAAAVADVRLALGWIDDNDLATYLGAADVAVLPFREITNSASVMLALGAGVPVLVPARLPVFDEIDCPAVLRYDTDAGGVRAALAVVTNVAATTRQAWSQAARAYAEAHSWERLGEDTRALYAQVLERGGR